MSKFCCGVRAYYIPGAPCMLKANPLPPEGYANGSQGRMIDIVFHDDYVLPHGEPGEMIMIPPPQFIIMEVHHRGKKKHISIFPSKKQETELEYYRDGKEFVYRCYSNMIVLTFSLTIHETQGQTLERVILLLARLPGMNVGKITWPLLYVALSRTRRLSHMKFFPAGTTDLYHPMYFSHLLRLRMPSNLKKWYRSYENHCWTKVILREEHLEQVKKVERELCAVGKKKLMGLSWQKLLSLVKQLGHKATSRDRKRVLYRKLCEHMVKRSLWQDPVRHRDQSKKRKLSKDSIEDVTSRSVLRRSKRFRGNERTHREQRAKKRRRKIRPLPMSCQLDNLKRAKEKQPTKKLKNSKNIILVAQPLHVNKTYKGLSNLGQTCYFNSIIQCLFYCPLFRDVIVNVPQVDLSDAVLWELRHLFTRMANKGPETYLSPSRCYSAAIKIPECKRLQMNKNKQEDAGEFFLLLIEHLRKKFKAIADIFEGDLGSTMTCQQCSCSSSKTDPFKLLSLSFPERNNEQDSHNFADTHDIQSLLDDFVRPEIIYDYKCAPCAAKHPTVKTLHILSTPRVLILQLNRFQGLEKIKDFVEFPAQLALKFNCGGNEQHQLYRITGVVLHVGQNMEEGHYVSYVNAEGKWLKADDCSIRQVCWEMVRKMRVYLIFYVRL